MQTLDLMQLRAYHFASLDCGACLMTSNSIFDKLFNHNDVHIEINNSTIMNLNSH